jgi:hypothetical protein
MYHTEYVCDYFLVLSLTLFGRYPYDYVVFGLSDVGVFATLHWLRRRR